MQGPPMALSHLATACRRGDADAAIPVMLMQLSNGRPGNTRATQTMSVTRSYIAQKIFNALGVDILSTRDVAQDEDISSSTLSAHGVRRFVVPHYDTLGDDTHCTLVHCRVNDTYLISSAGRKYSLKVYRARWRSLESISNEVSCIQHLRARDIPVAAPMSRRDGDIITRIPTPEGVRYAVLFEWVQGMVPSFDDESHSAHIGHQLARLHTASDQMPADCIPRCLDMAALFDRPAARIRAHMESRRPQIARFDSLVESLSHRVRQAAGKMTDWGFCHGDVAHVNLSVDDHHVHFFDFEWCGSGWRTYDFATYIWSAHHFGNARDFRWEPLVNSYLEERPQFAACIQFIPLFVILRHFWHASEMIGLAPQLGTNVLGSKFAENFTTFCEEFDRVYDSRPTAQLSTLRGGYSS